MRRFWLTVAAVVLLAPVAHGQNVSAPLPVNSIPLPAIVQKASNSSSGSVSSLVKAFPNNNVAGNSIVVVCGVGNGTAPTISDTPANAYKQAAQVANGTAFNVAVFVATNIAAGANSVTVNNGGTTASIAMEIYEVSGLITTSTTAALDSTSTNISGAATTSPAVTAAPLLPNELSFVAFGLGTAAQTITVAAPYANATAPPNQLPTDLLVPVKLWERPARSPASGGDDFVEMADLSDHGGLPSRPQGATLGVWEWRADGLYFLGATQDTQVRIRYQKTYPDLADATSNVLIRNAQEAIAYLAAAMASMARGSPLAEKWDQAGDDALEDLIVRATQREQQAVRRRRPYSSRRGYVWL